MQQDQTNNAAEGWLNGLRCLQSTGSTSFHCLIDNLFKEAELIPLQAKLMSQKQVIRRQSPKFKELQAKLNEAWSCYNTKTLSSKKLLERCARLYYDYNKKKVEPEWV